MTEGEEYPGSSTDLYAESVRQAIVELKSAHKAMLLARPEIALMNDRHTLTKQRRAHLVKTINDWFNCRQWFLEENSGVITLRMVCEMAGCQTSSVRKKYYEYLAVPFKLSLAIAQLRFLKDAREECRVCVQARSGEERGDSSEVRAVGKELAGQDSPCLEGSDLLRGTEAS